MQWQDKATGQIEILGKALEYMCFGPGPDMAPTIVLLHEGLGSAALWRQFPAELAEATGCGVFVYSRAGYGRSAATDLPRPLDYMTREAMDVLPVVLDQIGFRQGILLGHSDGATIAAIYAGSAQDHRVRGLVLMAPHFFTEDIGLAAIAKAKEAFETGDLRDRMAKHHDDPDNAFRGWNDAWLDPGFKAWDVSEVIDYLRIPALVIQGASDQYGTLAQVTEVEERSYAPVDVVVLDDCRHSPHLDQPQAVLTAVTEFSLRLQRIENEKVTAA